MKLFEIFKKKDYPAKEEKSYQPPTNNDNAHLPLDGIGLGVMPVDGVFALLSSSCVVTGKISNGYFSVGDSVEIIHKDGSIIKSSIGEIEKNMQKIDRVQAGDNASLMFRDVNKRNVQPGDMIRNIGRPEEE